MPDEESRPPMVREQINLSFMDGAHQTVVGYPSVLFAEGFLHVGLEKNEQGSGFKWGWVFPLVNVRSYEFMVLGDE